MIIVVIVMIGLVLAAKEQTERYNPVILIHLFLKFLET